MDQEQSIISVLYDRIKNIPNLPQIAPTLEVYLVQPDEDAPAFPYLCHRIALGTPPDAIVNRGTYYLDIWDHADRAERVTQIRNELVKLLDLRNLVNRYGNTSPIRLSLEAQGFVPTDEKNIWHYAMAFHIRYGRITEIDDILA